MSRHRKASWLTRFWQWLICTEGQKYENVPWMDENGNMKGGGNERA